MNSNQNATLSASRYSINIGIILV